MIGLFIVTNGSLSTEQAKSVYYKEYSKGASKERATAVAGVSRNTPANWLKNDDEFARKISKVDKLKAVGRFVTAVDAEDVLDAADFAEAVQRSSDVPDFAVFSEKFLKMKVWPHQQNIMDAFDGLPPSWEHPAIQYVPGELERVIVNIPPNHAKTTTIENKIVHMLVKNPFLKVAIISKTQDQAKKNIHRIGNILTHPDFVELQETFAPPGGWKSRSSSWTKTAIYLANANSQDRDATISAYGAGSQVYGSRFDVIVVDDMEDLSTAKDYAKHIEWLNSEVFSRLPPSGGKIIIVGTRLANKDVYSELLNNDYYNGEESPWSYLLMPAMLEDGETEADVVTLWPESDRPRLPHEKPNVNGMFDAWSPAWAIKQRKNLSAATWQRMYQQQTSTDESIFSASDIKACTSARAPGLIPADVNLGREHGMDGLYVIGGLDPAAANFSALVVYGVDLRAKQRFVVDVHNEKAMNINRIFEKMLVWTAKYGIKEWRIEDNAAQKFLLQNLELKQKLSALGCTMHAHTTGRNKQDDELGVAAMSTLFSAGLIDLPSSHANTHMKTLVEQLVVWDPSVAQRVQHTDTVMALWFVELRAIELIRNRARKSFEMTGDKLFAPPKTHRKLF